MAGAVALRLFGAPQIKRGGASVPFACERRFQLLAYLAARGDWVTRDQLAELLFPDRDNAAARSNLRKVLHGARQFLWAADLEARGELVRWPVASDVRDFEQAMIEGRTAAAVNLYGGTFGLGLDDANCPPFTEWLEFERDRLAMRWRGAAIELLRNMQPEPALTLTERLLAADPYDDEALRLRLEAFGALGRGRDAQRTYRDFSERLAEELGIEPSAASRAAAARFVEGAAVARPAPPPGVTELIGRERELDELAVLLAEPDTRMITITGVGGVGKTRLARRAFEQVSAARFRANAFWLELADLNSIDHLIARTADAVGLTLRRGDPREQLVHYLGDRVVLIVFDNCEHLIGSALTGGVARLIEDLLSACPHLVLLLTSRVRLHIAQERLLPLAGLGHLRIDADVAEALAQPAAQLFIARARHVLPSFEAESHTDAIAAICRLTEGLPLALELSAAWVHMLPCTEIAADLRARLEVTESSVPGGRGLRATFERSWQLAAPAERQTLARLSVISGKFTREAARSIADASLPMLAGLVDKSLVVADFKLGQFSLHPLVRAFALEKLAATPTTELQTRAEHAAHFCQFLAQFRNFETIDQKQALAAIGDQLENVCTAWCWACERRDVDFIAAITTILRSFFASKGRCDEGLRLFGAAEEVLAPLGREADVALCELGCATAILLRQNGEFARAEAVARRVLPLSRACNRRQAMKSCLNTIGTCSWLRGRMEDAARYLSAGLRLAQADCDAADIAVFSNNLGILDSVRGDAAAAQAHYQRALQAEREMGNERACVSVLQNLGNLQRLTGRYAQAIASLSEALRICDSHGFDSMRCPLLLGLATTHIDANDLVAARESVRLALAALGTSQRQYEPIAHQLSARLAVFEGDFAEARGRLARAMRTATERDQVFAQLSIVASWGELAAAEGDLPRAAALWSFARDHPKTEALERHQVAQRLAELPLAESERKKATNEASGLRLESVRAEILAGAGSLSSREGSVATAKSDAMVT